MNNKLFQFDPLLPQEGINQNITLHSASLNHIQKQYDLLYVDDVEQSEFYGLLKDMDSKGFKDTDKVKRIQNEGKDIIINQIIPAFKKLNKFINDTYVEHEHLRSGPGMVLSSFMMLIFLLKLCIFV